MVEKTGEPHAHSGVESVGSNDVAISFENKRRRKDAYTSSSTEIIHSHTVGSFGHDIGISSRSTMRKRSSNARDMDALVMKLMENFNAYIAEKRERKRASKQELNECIAHLSAIEGLPNALIIKAVNKLKSANNRRVFLPLQGLERRIWVELLDD